MSRRAELISPEGLRLDGRRAQELRSVNAAMGVISGRLSEGSSSFEIGNTRVLATVFGPREMSNDASESSGGGAGDLSVPVVINDGDANEKGRISVKIHAASFSSTGGERRKNTRQDRRLLEWARYLEETFSSVVMTSTFPRSQLDIFVEISNADGGVLPTLFNAVTLALLDAGIPMEDYVIAGSVSYVQGHFLLDPNRLEESSACPVLTAALLPRSQNICFLNSELRLASDKLPTMLDLLKRGVQRVFEQVDTEVVRPYLFDLIDKKNNNNNSKK